MWKWRFNATAEHRTSLAPARRGGRGGRGGRGVESETLMELMRRRRKRRRKHGWALLHYSCSRLQAVRIIHHNESEPSFCGLDCFPFNFLFFSLLKKTWDWAAGVSQQWCCAFQICSQRADSFWDYFVHRSPSAERRGKICLLILLQKF